MVGIPAVDPIPLPAPVWLFVALHNLTLVLHFCALHLLVGGLMLSTVWAFMGRRGDGPARQASQLVARKLPVVMTYVINLGVPPLLFAQVLYGRALYTSSILIGVWWFSVVGLLILGYSLLYVLTRRGETGRTAGWIGLGALLTVLTIGMIYSTNMSLMLRPDTWQAIYRAHPTGTSFHTGDPTVVPRWLSMMLGSLSVAGVGLLVLALTKNVPDDLRGFFARWGGQLAAAFTAVQAALAYWALQAQPDATREAFSGAGLNRVYVVAWLVTAALVVVAGLAASLRAKPAKALVYAAAGASFLNVAALVLARDGLRNAALSRAGFDVWDRAVSTNWSTVGLFLILFVAALGMLGWLASVMLRAKPVSAAPGA